MQEIEVKVLEVNREEVVAKLLERGAKLILDSDLIDTIFDTPDLALDTRGELLRIRQEDNESILTFKAAPTKIARIKSSKETELIISDSAAFQSILESLNMKPVRTLNKHRTSYRLDNVRFDFDKLLGENDFVPEYLEVETDNQDVLLATLSDLGFTKDDYRAWGTRKLIRKYRDGFTKNG